MRHKAPDNKTSISFGEGCIADGAAMLGCKDLEMIGYNKIHKPEDSSGKHQIYCVGVLGPEAEFTKHFLFLFVWVSKALPIHDLTYFLLQIQEIEMINPVF